MMKHSLVWTVILASSLAAELSAAPAGLKADPLAKVNLPALRLAVVDMARSFPKRYPRVKALLKQIDAYTVTLARPALAFRAGAGRVPR